MAIYSAVLSIGTPATNPTDVAMLTGSATKTVRILEVTLDGICTSAANIRGTLVKRTTASTGNVITSGVMVPLNSGSAAATAAVTYWSSAAGNPSVLGSTTGGGTVSTNPIFLPAANGVGAQTTNANLLPPALVVLNGTSEFLALNLGAIAQPSGFSSFVASIVWEEI